MFEIIGCAIAAVGTLCYIGWQLHRSNNRFPASTERYNRENDVLASIWWRPIPDERVDG